MVDYLQQIKELEEELAETKRTLVVSNFIVRVNCPILLKLLTVMGIGTEDVPAIALVTLAAVIIGASIANKGMLNMQKNRKGKRNTIPLIFVKHVVSVTFIKIRFV